MTGGSVVARQIKVSMKEDSILLSGAFFEGECVRVWCMPAHESLVHAYGCCCGKSDGNNIKEKV